MLQNFFYSYSDPTSHISGSYNLMLVFLSYLIASFASYVALDIAKNIHLDAKNSKKSILNNKWALLGGAFTLGAGIWTMHFIGMEAFNMSMPMSYDPKFTLVSMLCAIIASGLAFLLVSTKENIIALLLGGVIIGLGISTMHYLGMAAMLHVTIKYIPSLFFLSILIAILAAQAALWALINLKFQSTIYQIYLNLIVALIMGGAICGMHYVGMSAAVFYPEHPSMDTEGIINPEILSYYIATTTILIMGIGLFLSTYRQKTLNEQKKLNEELQAKEKVLKKQKQDLIEASNILAEQEKKIHTILETAADGIITVNEHGNIQLSNHAAESMFHYFQHEFDSLNIFSIIKPKSSNNKNSFSLEDLVFRKVQNFEMIGITKQKEYFPIELSISKVQLAQSTNYVLIIRNITERKATEEKLSILNNQLIGAARQAGKVEIVNSVLHNVGNVLNSVNISNSILKDSFNNSIMHTLQDASSKIEKNKNNLIDFLIKDPQGIHFFDYITLLANTWKNEYSSIIKELDVLSNKIDHIKLIIQRQQSLDMDSNFIEQFSIKEIIEEALSINNLLNVPGFTVETDFKFVSIFSGDKVKILQILVNILHNAKDSLIESENAEKKINIKCSMNENNHLVIQIADNGIGISSENLKNIFLFGFTTKKTGHGFGMHASALSAREMNGSIRALSEGLGKGAEFVLEIPSQKVLEPV